jgi:putative intracellular protease/amidase
VAARLTATPRLDERTVVDGRIITSQGAGTTFEFALTLIRLVDGPEKARAIAESIVLG